MKYLTILALLSSMTLVTVTDASAQIQQGGLIEVEKKADPNKSKSPINASDDELSLEEQAELEAARQKAKAASAKQKEKFMAGKGEVDEARQKVQGKKKLYKEKLNSGKWSRAKYEKKMTKLDKKEAKVKKKQMELIESIK